MYVQPLLAIAYRLSYKSKIIQLGSLNYTHLMNTYEHMYEHTYVHARLLQGNYVYLGSL